MDEEFRNRMLEPGRVEQRTMRTIEVLETRPFLLEELAEDLEVWAPGLLAQFEQDIPFENHFREFLQALHETQPETRGQVCATLAAELSRGLKARETHPARWDSVGIYAQREGR